jgi:hypothetical protein
MSNRRRAVENLILGFLVFIGFLGLVGLVGYFTIPYEIKFQSGGTTVSYERPHWLWSYEPYKPGDMANLTVTVEEGARVVIRTLTLRSSIPGLSNVTLFSGGSIYWGQYLTYDPNEKAKTSEIVILTIPDSARASNTDAIKADVVVSYAYAMPSGFEFLNLFSEDIVPIEISLIRPGPPNELVVMVAMVVLSVSLGAFLVKERMSQ